MWRCFLLYKKKLVLIPQLLVTKWKAFMNCIEKIKGLPPIGDSDSCEGCPKFKHRDSVVTYPGYREETQKEKDFIDKCIKKGCTTLFINIIQLTYLHTR